MMDHSILALIGFVVLVTVVPCFAFLGIVIKDYKQREMRFDSMVRSLQNNLSAKDLSGYLALQANEPENKLVPKMNPGRSDDEEAFLESQRMLMQEGTNGDAYS